LLDPKVRKDASLLERLRLKRLTLHKLTKVAIGERDDVTVNMLHRAARFLATGGICRMADPRSGSKGQ